MTDPRMRASDADRQATVDRLAAGFTAGRLTASEYDERVQQAYATTYLDELPALTADLPGPDPAGRRRRWDQPEHGRSADAYRTDATDGPDTGFADAGWPGRDIGGWGRGGYGDRWERRRRPARLVPLIVLAVVLIALSHGFILIPLFWIGMVMLFIGRRRRGHCGPRFGPHGVR